MTRTDQGPLCSHKFTGKERDSESGLDNFGARYDASTLGRFMSPDPSGLALADPTDPQQLNFYTYVRNNPLSLTDPLGLDCVYLDNNGGTNPNGQGGASIDHNSSAGECHDTQGNWIGGTVASLNDVYTDPNSNWVTGYNTSGEKWTDCQGSGECSSSAFAAFNGNTTTVTVNGDAPQEEPLSQDQMTVLGGVEQRTHALNKQLTCISAGAMATLPFNPDDVLGSLKGDVRDKAIDVAKKGFEKASDPAVAAKLAAKAGKGLGPKIAKGALKFAPAGAKLAGAAGLAFTAKDAIDAYRTCSEHF
jgi:RHS repeat-associated protein